MTSEKIVKMEIFFRNTKCKIQDSKLFSKFFNKQTDSLKTNRFLKRVANGVYNQDKKTGKAYMHLDDDSSIVELAIRKGYVRGIEFDSSSYNCVGELIVTSPSVTEEGEHFLRNHSFFTRHPFFEKIVIASVSSIITILIGHFSK